LSVALSAEAGPRGEPARAILVGVDFGRKGEHFDASLDELALLAESAGDVAVARVIARRKAPDPAFFVGSGKADELKEMVPLYQAEVVVFDQALSPAQQRNLERHLGVAVADRTMLILEIFGERARSHEGKLQVELARLQYLSTRLVRRWSHLERQRGGIGTRGGPGEAQIELDRRMIGERIKSIKKQLEKVKRQRGTQRRARERNQTFRVSLVGYTNAGKSTLFNSLVKADAYVADQLFATLDTTTRQLHIEQIERGVALSDTVGFIRDLPHTLIEAFQATLQEAADADLLLHVVDASSPELAEQMRGSSECSGRSAPARWSRSSSSTRSIGSMRPSSRAPWPTASSCPPGGGCRAALSARSRARGWTRCASASPTWRCAIRRRTA
jgi:GTP-binding protein HflX